VEFPHWHWLWKGAVEDGCVEYPSPDSTAWKKVFFHLINDACLIGEGWCSGFFFFFFLFSFPSPRPPVLQIYEDCRDFSIRPQDWDLMYHYKKWTGTSAESLPTFSLPWKQKSWTAIGTRYEGLSYSWAHGEPRLLLMRSVHSRFSHPHFRNIYHDLCDTWSRFLKS